MTLNQEILEIATNGSETRSADVVTEVNLAAIPGRYGLRNVRSL